MRNVGDAVPIEVDRYGAVPVVAPTADGPLARQIAAGRLYGMEISDEPVAGELIAVRAVGYVDADVIAVDLVADEPVAVSALEEHSNRVAADLVLLQRRAFDGLQQHAVGPVALAGEKTIAPEDDPVG